jgi:hypothetical protein
VVQALLSKCEALNSIPSIKKKNIYIYIYIQINALGMLRNCLWDEEETGGWETTNGQILSFHLLFVVGMVQVEECLSSKHKALSSNSSI